MSKTTSRYRSDSQRVMDEFRNLVFEESSQSILHSIEKKNQSLLKPNISIEDLKSKIKYLEDNDFVHVMPSEIKLRGNVTVTSKII